MSIHPAIDILKLTDYGALRGLRYGLLTHASACDESLVPTYERLGAIPDVRPRALFSPEHGLMTAVPDGLPVGHGVDLRTKLPVYSLYGETKKPTPEMLTGIDVLVVDLVDIGTRFYTYIWTLSLVLEACAENGIEIVVLDRPNPLGGQILRGPLTEPDSTSFVGRYAGSLPIMHGMTIGELTRFFNGEFLPKPARVSVVSISGWRREHMWPDTGLTWIPTSPAMPHYTTALHYPGAALLEGTTLSEGRGTALPFEIVGAPGIDAFALADALNRLNLVGVRFRPHTFRPGLNKHAGQDCQGVQAHITNRQYFNPLRVWMSVLLTIRTMYPDIFDWTPPVGENQHFDMLIGNRTVRPMIENGATVDDIFFDEHQALMRFVERRQPYLLYA